MKLSQLKFLSIAYKLILFSLVIIFTYFIVYGEVGLYAYYSSKEQVEKEKTKLVKVCKQIDDLEQEVANWNSDNFYLEKMAREDLCMGHKDEIIYLVD